MEALATDQINQVNISTSSKMLYDNEKYYGNVNSEWFNHYKKTIDNYRVYFEFDIYNNIKPILENFFADKITIDKAVNEINNKIRMMINE